MIAHQEGHVVVDSAAVSTDTGAGYVDWCAIAAGAMVATAVSIILFTFGTAVGLSLVSPYEGEGVSRAVYFAALGLWTLWLILSSFMAGGYIAGRLRRRVGDGTEHEVDVRDGAHGLLVWATGVVVASLLVLFGVTGMAGTAIQASAPATAAASGGAGGMVAYTVDALFRAPATTNMTSMTQGADTDRERGEVERLLVHGLSDGTWRGEDRSHVARLIANRTGLSQAEAEARIDTVLAEAKETADAARKIGILIGFLMAAALVVAAAAAAWAATLGGRHRDRNTDTSAFWRWA